MFGPVKWLHSGSPFATTYHSQQLGFAPGKVAARAALLSVSVKVSPVTLKINVEGGKVEAHCKEVLDENDVVSVAINNVELEAAAERELLIDDELLRDSTLLGDDELLEVELPRVELLKGTEIPKDDELLEEDDLVTVDELLTLLDSDNEVAIKIALDRFVEEG